MDWFDLLAIQENLVQTDSLSSEPPGKPNTYMYLFFFPQVAQLVKNPPAMQETPVPFLGQEDPLDLGLHGNPLQYPCLENLHEQTGLVGYSPRGHTEWGMTERLSIAAHVFSNSLPIQVITEYRAEFPVLYSRS